MAKETKNETAKEKTPETIRVRAKQCMHGASFGCRKRDEEFDLLVEDLPAWKDSVVPVNRNEPALRTS